MEKKRFQLLQERMTKSEFTKTTRLMAIIKDPDFTEHGKLTYVNKNWRVDPKYSVISANAELVSTYYSGEKDARLVTPALTILA